MTNVTLIGNHTVNVSTNETVNITTSWNATLGNHTIYVLADPKDSIQESNETNNIANKTIEVICGKGDFDCDGVVSFSDYIKFEIVYGSICGDLRYDSLGDFNDDCVIDFIDFVRFARVYED